MWAAFLKLKLKKWFSNYRNLSQWVWASTFPVNS